MEGGSDFVKTFFHPKNYLGRLGVTKTQYFTSNSPIFQPLKIKKFSAKSDPLIYNGRVKMCLFRVILECTVIGYTLVVRDDRY